MAKEEVILEIRNPTVMMLVAFLAIVLFLELRVTLGSPIVFGDSGFHTRMAQWIAEKTEYPVWVPFEGTRLWRESFHRPPLYHLLQASFLAVLGFNELIIKLSTPLVGLLTGLVIFLLVKRLYGEGVGFAAAVIAVTVPSFVTYAVLFYTDILFTLYTSLFFLLFMLAMKGGDRKYLALAGVFGSFAFLTKIPGLAVYPFVALAFLYQLATGERLCFLLRRYAPLVLILGLMPGTYLLRNYFYYKTPLCYDLPLFSLDGCRQRDFEAKHRFAGRVEQVGTEQPTLRMGIMNYLNFAYGPVWFVTFGFLCGLMMALLRRTRTDMLALLALAVLILILPRAVARAEDTARFVLGWVGLIALFAGRYFEEVYDFIKGYQKHLALAIFLVIVVLSWQNLAGKLDIMAQVKRFSPTFFEACDWVRVNTRQDVLLMTIWAHRATYNCQRDTTINMADIALSRDVNYTLNVAKQHGITHLFIQKFSIDPANRHLAERYDWDFIQFLERHRESFVKVYQNGIPVDQCPGYWQRGLSCDGNVIYEINMTGMSK